MSENARRHRPRGLRRERQGEVQPEAVTPCRDGGDLHRFPVNASGTCADCDEPAPIPERFDPAAAARASFEEDHSLGGRSWGRGRHSSIPKTHGAEGRNWAGD